jgi:hypothetical protein
MLYTLTVRYECRVCGCRWREDVQHTRMIDLPLIVSPACQGCFEDGLEIDADLSEYDPFQSN